MTDVQTTFSMNLNKPNAMTIDSIPNFTNIFLRKQNQKCLLSHITETLSEGQSHSDWY